MTYEELLKDIKWSQRRYLILRRDSLCCKNCHNEIIKKNSRPATFLKQLDHTQAGDLRKKPFGLINIYNVEIQDDDDGSIHQAYIRLWPELYADHNFSGLKFFYSNDNCEKGEETDNTSVITLVEKSKGSDLQTTIYARSLHVHHKYYQEETFPWDYPDEALITLCWRCHKKLHEEEKIEWFTKNGNPKGYLKPCDRCYGAGYFPQYVHIQNGICFKCRGAKYLDFLYES